MKPARIPSVRFALAATALVAALAFAASRPVTHEPVPVEYGNAYDDLQPFMEGVYAADRQEVGDGKRVRAVIVPHHLLASPSIALGIRALQGSGVKKILLLSPDHFGHCPTLACTVNGTYQTAFGETRSDAATVKALAASPFVTQDAELFEREHGVFAVLPFIAHYAPGIPVTPLALSQRLPWKGSRGELLALIASVADDGTVLVVSSDFSHYLPLQAAEAMDAKTREALFAKDLDGIASLDNADQSDCPNCLWTLASLADARGFYGPQVLLHTNSAVLLDDQRIPETTSHFSILWREED